MHGRPSSNGPLLPMTRLETVPARILQPGNPATLRITFEHEGAILMADYDILTTIAGDINCSQCNRRIEYTNFIFLPGYRWYEHHKQRSLPSYCTYGSLDWVCPQLDESHTLVDRLPQRWGYPRFLQLQIPILTFVGISMSVIPFIQRWILTQQYRERGRPGLA